MNNMYDKRENHSTIYSSNILKMEKRLENLLLGKKFNQLTAEEKYYVTESIGEVEYNRLHIFLNESKKTLKNTPSVSPRLKKDLMKSFRQQHPLKELKKQPAIVRLMRYRIPAWQAVAAVALLLGLHFWLQEGPQIIKETETVYVNTVDTIFKEVAMPSPIPKKSVTPPPARLNVKPKTETPLPISETPLLASVDSSNRQYEYELMQVADTFDVKMAQPKGQSLTQTADLWESLGEVY